MLELIDVKKVQKDYILKYLSPVLYKHGFVLSKPTTYIREQKGLLQEFYFRVEASKLRPWVSLRPVFDARNVVTFGIDSIYMHDITSPYYGYGWVTFEGSKQMDIREFNAQFLSKFDRLVRSIVNGVLPELDTICSMDEFIRLYNDNGLLFQKRIQSYPNAKEYYDFINNVSSSSGIERMNLLLKVMEEWNLQNLPKVVSNYLQICKSNLTSDAEADIIFEKYCNAIRDASKLK